MYTPNIIYIQKKNPTHNCCLLSTILSLYRSAALAVAIELKKTIAALSTVSSKILKTKCDSCLTHGESQSFFLKFSVAAIPR